MAVPLLWWPVVVIGVGIGLVAQLGIAGSSRLSDVQREREPHRPLSAWSPQRRNAVVESVENPTVRRG